MTAVKPVLSITLPNFGTLFPAGQWRRFIDLARLADDEGIGRMVVSDHVVMGTHTENYRWGSFPTRFDDPWLEPLTVLAAVAAVTARIRLGTSILLAPLRGPAVLAKTAATLDVLSGGRLDLGVQTGWQREEYDANGTNWDRRSQLLTDTIAACKTLWRDSPASFESETVSFRDIYCLPKPLQPDGVPIWIGGSLNRRSLERLTRWGDGWIPPSNETAAGMAAGVKRIREAWSSAGRDSDGLRVQAYLPLARDANGSPDLARTIEATPELVALGGTAIGLHFRSFCSDPADARPFFREAADRFAALTRAA